MLQGVNAGKRKDPPLLVLHLSAHPDVSNGRVCAGSATPPVLAVTISSVPASPQPQLGSSASLLPKEAVTDNKHQSNPTSNLIVFAKYH